MLLSGEAPGRVCLLGEHCDWAGGSCLVAPLPRTLRVRVAPAHATSIRSKLGVTAPPDDARALLHDPHRYVAAVLLTLRERGWAIPPLAITITSEIPEGRGFSSSAALCVATARAVAAACGQDPDPAELAEIAYTAEHDRLGVGCGRMDPLACAYAAPLFVRFGPTLRVRTLQRPPPPTLAAASASGRPAEEILSALAANLDRVQPTIHRWGALAEAGAGALERGDLPALGACMNEAQHAYEALDLPELAAPWLREAVRAARAAGALGAKFTGAGGDRSLVAIFASPAALHRGAGALRSLGAEVIGSTEGGGATVAQ